MWAVSTASGLNIWTIAGLASLVLAVGAALGFMRAYSNNKSTVNTIEILNRNVEALEQQNAIQAREIASLKRQNQSLEAAMSVLKDQFSGKQQLDDLKQLLQQHHRELLEAIHA